MNIRFLLFPVIAGLLFQARAEADTSAAGSLPMLWKGVDVGTVTAGSMTNANGTFTVKGADTGADLIFAAPYDNAQPRRFYRLQIGN